MTLTPRERLEGIRPELLHVLGTGVAYRGEAIEAALAYSYQHETARNKNNAIGGANGALRYSANGRYRADLHALAISLTYRF